MDDMELDYVNEMGNEVYKPKSGCDTFQEAAVKEALASIIEELEGEKHPITDIDWFQGKNTGLDRAISIVRGKMEGE